MKKIVDLFAGCGGLSLGFQNAGFETIGAFEHWGLAADCYELNFKHPVFREDLSDTETAIKKIKTLQPEIIIGGPPCQDFSQAGKRVENERAGLTESFAIITTNIRPQWFVMENVDRAQRSAAYARARAMFKDAGYGLTETVLDASMCGVPQKRKRFFCIGSLGQEDGYLDACIQSAMSEKETTVRDYFGNTLDFEYYYRHPRNYSRRAVYSIDEPAPTIRGMNRPVPPGYPGHPNDAKPLDGTIRAMTTLERALIQTFPANFKWLGNKTDLEQMIGNAVPVKLAEFVAVALRRHTT
jgi:DNA (cytosine-5)-methyltransferase 1